MTFNDSSGCLSDIGFLVLGLALSWGLTEAVMWAVSMCFGWEFSVIAATGVWLLLMLARVFLYSGEK